MRNGKALQKYCVVNEPCVTEGIDEDHEDHATYEKMDR
jgi:hypothetical protein